MPTNLSLEGIIVVFRESITLLLIGIYFIQLYAKEKRWDGSYKTAFKVSILWLVIHIPLKIFFLYLLGNSKIFVPLRILPEIIISSLIVAKYYNKEYLESLTFLI
ncbi:MAG: hypothetical protein ACXACB_06590, partial [Promethearchaeota archaeon]